MNSSGLVIGGRGSARRRGLFLTGTRVGGGTTFAALAGGELMLCQGPAGAGPRGQRLVIPIDVAGSLGSPAAGTL